jgi:hypothetical protein
MKPINLRDDFWQSLRYIIANHLQHDLVDKCPESNMFDLMEKSTCMNLLNQLTPQLRIDLRKERFNEKSN